jgi:hypothetical protein
MDTVKPQDRKSCSDLQFYVLSNPSGSKQGSNPNAFEPLGSTTLPYKFFISTKRLTTIKINKQMKKKQ